MISLSNIVKGKQLAAIPPPTAGNGFNSGFGIVSNSCVSIDYNACPDSSVSLDYGIIPKNYTVLENSRLAGKFKFSEKTGAAAAAGRADKQTARMNETDQQKTVIRQAILKANHIANEARSRADSLIENAIKTSRKIIADAEKKGYEEGYLRGLIDGAGASESAAEEGLLELQRLIDLFKTDQKAELERNEKDLIEIAFELAKKIMKQHVQADGNAIQKMLQEIVAENEGSYKICFSEYQKTLDIHIDKAAAAKMRNLAKDTRLVLIKEEDLITCEREDGIVDMSIPVQLERLKKAVDREY